MTLHILFLCLSLASAAGRLILHRSAPATLIPEVGSEAVAGLGPKDYESQETTRTWPQANGSAADLGGNSGAWMQALADAALEAEVAWAANTTNMHSTLQNNQSGEVLEIVAPGNVVQLVIPCDTGTIIEQAWIERLMSGCGPVKIQCLENLAACNGCRRVFVVMVHKNHFHPPPYNVHQKVINTMKRLSLNPANHVMVHVGDEWETSRGIRSQSGHLSDPAWPSLQKIYRPWGKVFRQFDNGMDTYFPLGWTAKFAQFDMYKRMPVKASDRGHVLSFIGSTWAGREGQLMAYQQNMQASGLTLNRDKDQLIDSKSNPADRYHDDDPRYTNTLANSAFCLQLAGASTECYRLYEALEVGCIPVVEPSPYWQNFGARIDGPHASGLALPFLFAKPELAGTKIAELLANPASLNKMQQQNIAWWEKVKSKYTWAFRKSICPQKGKGKGKGKFKFKGKFKGKFKAKAKA